LKIAEVEKRRKAEERRAAEIQKEEERMETLKQEMAGKLTRIREREEARQQRAERNREGIQREEEKKNEKVRKREIVGNKGESQKKQKVAVEVRITTEEKKMTERQKKAEEREISRTLWFEKWKERRMNDREQLREKREEKIQNSAIQREVRQKQNWEIKVSRIVGEDVLTMRRQNLEAEKQKQRRKKMFIEQLKKEERDQNAEHIARRKEFQRAEERARQISEGERILAFEQEKLHRESELREKSLKLEQQKADLNATFKERLRGDKATLDSVRLIAQQYGVDIELLRERSARQSGTPSRIVRVSRIANQ
jgi:hypothetical protein